MYITIHFQTFHCRAKGTFLSTNLKYIDPPGNHITASERRKSCVRKASGSGPAAALASKTRAPAAKLLKGTKHVMVTDLPGHTANQFRYTHLPDVHLASCTTKSWPGNKQTKPTSRPQRHIPPSRRSRQKTTHDASKPGSQDTIARPRMQRSRFRRPGHPSRTVYLATRMNSQLS